MERLTASALSRREFLKQLTWMGVTGATFFGCAQTSQHVEVIKEANAASATRIVLVQSPDGLQSAAEVRLAQVQKMLDAAMVRLTDAEDVRLAWRKFFRAEDIVAIKLNCLAGPQLSSHVEIAQAIVRRLTELGIPPSHIILWERSNRELVNAGYTINRQGREVRCYGTDDDRAGYGGQFVAGSVISRLSKIVTSHCTALINLPVLKDHNIAGVTASMKNWYGAIHNPNKYHPNHGDPYIADLSTHPMIRDKTRLIVCDALRVLYEGGPSYDPRYVWDYSGLLIGTDPVALDQTATLLLEEKRRERGLPPFEAAGRPPRYIATAAERGLGVHGPDRIECVRMVV